VNLISRVSSLHWLKIIERIESAVFDTFDNCQPVTAVLVIIKQQAVRVATQYAPAPLLPWAPKRLARRRADAT